jgi:hypothetical protein
MREKYSLFVTVPGFRIQGFRVQRFRGSGFRGNIESEP